MEYFLEHLFISCSTVTGLCAFLAFVSFPVVSRDWVVWIVRLSVLVFTFCVVLTQPLKIAALERLSLE